jgi:hypothetical protein
MTELLGFLPLLLLVGALLLRRYPGERLLTELRRRRISPRRVPEPVVPRIRRHAEPRLPRGGTLIGAFLAGRAPPAIAQRST